MVISLKRNHAESIMTVIGVLIFIFGIWFCDRYSFEMAMAWCFGWFGGLITGWLFNLIEKHYGGRK
jgi:multisubunit Na+/H+ antiporter MnhG subunit